MPGLQPERIDFSKSWLDLRPRVHNVVSLQPITSIVWRESFTDIYKICVGDANHESEDNGSLGWERLYTEIEIFLNDHVKGMLERISSLEGADLLEMYHKCWAEYKEGTSYLNLMFRYLNGQLAPRTKSSFISISSQVYGTEFDETDNKLEIRELAMDIWKNILLQRLSAVLVENTLTELQSDRICGGARQNIIRSVVDSMVEIEEHKGHKMITYQKCFEKPFMVQTCEFYKKESQSLLAEVETNGEDFCVFLDKALAILSDEVLLAQKFLHPSTKPKLLSQLQQTLVGDNLAKLSEVITVAVRHENKHHMSCLYELLKPFPEPLKEFADVLETHIASIASDLVLAVKTDCKDFMKVTLQIHQKYSALVKQHFKNDPVFTSALDCACVTAFNQRASPKSFCRSAEMLVKFADTLLKKSGAKGLTESEIDDKLSNSVTIFRYISDKDVYQKLYSRALARRLMHRDSNSMDTEEAMIQKLRNACGFEYTVKLQRMFTDIGISSDLVTAFERDDEDTPSTSPLQFSILVLTAGSWPISQTCVPQFSLSNELAGLVSRFEAFYKGKFSGRKLTWIHHFSSVEVRFHYLPREYIAHCSTFQLGVLLQFNDKTGTDASVTFGEMQQGTDLDTVTLSSQIISLIGAKILSCDEPEKLQAHDPSCVLRLNMNFSERRIRFGIKYAAQKDSPQQEIESAKHAVTEDRKLCLQATIVRIMKTRKSISHNQLIEEVVRQSTPRFQPDIQMVKKAIELLIDKQYIERNSDMLDQYNYLA